MAHTATIVGRVGRMENGEHVTVIAYARAEDSATGVVGTGEGPTDAKAEEAAVANMNDRIAEKQRRAAEAAARAAEDPLARLARLEAIVKEAGLDG